MQPRLPHDHHFHRRSSASPPAPRRPLQTASRHVHAATIGASASAADYLSRQCLPAFDPRDPREAA